MRVAGQNAPVPDRPPKQVNPPRQPSDTHPRLAIALGVTVLPWTHYNYQTTITLSSGRPLQYSGTGSAPGITVFASPALTLPGPLRRISLGTNLAAGGLYSLSDAVIPPGASAPFSIENLQQTIKAQHSFGQGWHAFVSPYIEHDIVSIRDNKLRLGYQFLTQSGEYSGSFPPNPVGLATASYDVQLRYRVHLIRFSWSNHLYADDYGRGGQPAEHRTGLLRQMGVCAGTHGTVQIFFAIGPIWDL